MGGANLHADIDSSRLPFKEIRRSQKDPEIFRWFTYWLYTGSLTGHNYPSTAKPSIARIQAVLKNEMKVEQRIGISDIENLPLRRLANSKKWLDTKICPSTKSEACTSWLISSRYLDYSQPADGRV